MFTYAWWLSLATCLGIAILAVPVWSLNARKRDRHMIQAADRSARNDSDFRLRTRKILLGRHDRQVNDWRRRDEICLLVGYTLVLGSALMRVIVVPT